MASHEKQDKQPANSSRKFKPIPVNPNLKSSGKVGDWVRHVSASAGKEYYYNITTSNSQWEKPKEWIAFEDKYGSVPHELVTFSDLLTVENSVITTNTKAPQAKNETTVIQFDTMGYKENKATLKVASPDLEILRDLKKEPKTKESGDDREQAIRQLYDQAARLGIKLPTLELNLKVNKDPVPITNETMETSSSVRETNRALSKANLKLTSDDSNKGITCLDSDSMKSEESSYSKSGSRTFSCISSTELEKLKKQRVSQIPKKKKNAEVECDQFSSSKRSRCEIPKPISKPFTPDLFDLGTSPPTPESLGQDFGTRPTSKNEELHLQKKDQHQAVKSINKKPANPYSSPTAPIRTRPPDLENKRGSIGEPVNLVVNYFPIRMLESGWEMFHYIVYFNPNEQVGRIRKQLLAQYETLFGVYMFDGCNLYTLSSLENCPIVLYAALKKSHAEIGDGSQVVEITIKSKSKIKPEDPFYYKFWSYFVHHAITKCLKLDKIGSNYFNLGETLSLGVAHEVEVCPGYTIKVRDYEAGLMLNVGFVHKVIRSENCLQVLKTFRNQSDGKREFVGTTVMTGYNQRTYKIYRVDWSKNPLYKFEWKGTWCSIKDYYKKKYGIEIKDSKQPLFVSLSTKNSTENENTLLVPELCQPVGLKQRQRKDYQLKRNLGNIVHSNPDKRLRSMQEFVKRLTDCSEFQNLMDSWRLSLDKNFATISGRIVPEEQVVLRFNGQRVSFPVGRKTDWRFPFIDHQMLNTKCLNHWAVLIHERDIQEWNLFVGAMRCAGKPSFHISNPIVIKLSNERKSTYLKVLEKTLNEHPNLEMIFLIIPNFEHGLYSALKRKLYVDHGIPSQCLLSKSLTDKGRNMTIIEKLLIQMNAKLGGEAWGCNNPLKISHTLVVGYSESGPNKEGIKIGAVVGTTNRLFSCYYSTSSTFSKAEENNRVISSDLIKCIQAYRYKNNNILPDRILLYRQTNGYQKELAFINNIELQDLKSNIHSYYVQCGHQPARFSMILVSRKPNTRFADAENPLRFSNPISGTVVDSVITLPELYDFYLVSAAPKDHFVISTNYNVIFDQQDLLPDQLQRLTYKLCYLYYNRTGPVHLPAMCLYAKRLAELTVSMGYVHVNDEKLKHTLFYL